MRKFLLIRPVVFRGDYNLRGFCTYDETRVAVEFIREDKEWEQIHFEMKEEGYPNANELTNFTAGKINGSKIAEKYKLLVKQEQEDDE